MISQACDHLRGMVTPLDGIRLSRCCGHVPLLFFSEILSLDKAPLETRKLLMHLYESLGSLRSRRQLVVPFGRKAWEANLSRRITRARQFVQTIIDESFVFGWKGFTQHETLALVWRWLILDWMGHSIKQMKLHVTWLSGKSRALEEECTTAGMMDLPGFLGVGRYRSWVLRKLRQSKSTTKTCPYSQSEIMGESFLLGTKRGCPSMEDVDVEEEAGAYQSKMAEAHPISGLYREQILVSLAETTREVFLEDFEHYALLEPQDVPYVPSQNAGYEAPRYSGGILGDIVRSKPSLLSRREPVSQIKMNGACFEVTGHWFDYLTATSEFMEEWGVEKEEVANCQIYMIREPLKLRTITAGTPSLYGNLAPLLKFMRDGMKRFECFRLTRQENNAAWLTGRLNVLPTEFRLQWDWINSGDYQQSTNDLSMEATDVVRKTAFKKAAACVAEKALGPQALWWGERASEQKNGQLMGSPLSFPVLCVINAALMRLAYQLAYPKLFGKRLDQFPFAVNGDDIVARLDLRVYDYWKQLLAGVNWKLSPGKSYLLKTYAQVNSQTMQVRNVRGAMVLTNPIPYLNSGFVQQMSKSTQQIDESPLDSFSDDWARREASLDRLPAGMRARGREVLNRNLTKFCSRLYADGLTPFQLKPGNPRGLGGFGLSGHEIDWKVAQMALASRKTAAPSFLSKIVAHEPPDPEPYLRLDPVQSKRGILDLLCDDVDRQVMAMGLRGTTQPVGLVDPCIQQVPSEDGDVGVRIYPSSFVLKTWELGANASRSNPHWEDY